MVASPATMRVTSSILRTAALALLAGLSAACGSPPPPAAPPAEAAPPPAPPSVGAAAPGIDKAAAEVCLATAGASRARFSGEPATVTVKHVLVKYKGSKNADPKITRSREAACLRAVEARDKVRGGADFAEVVREYSDEPGAATREGSIGAVERKDVLKPFADAAFELAAAQLSDVVETEFGFHVILRTQ
jgi:peptidyl-prolyl cis-trans isomerase NIMA-interacting 1